MRCTVTVLSRAVPVSACSGAVGDALAPTSTVMAAREAVSSYRSPISTVDPLTVTIAASGDILSHQPVTTSAQAYAAVTEIVYDYAPMFAPIRELLDLVNLALCHPQTPISRDNTNLGITG